MIESKLVVDTNIFFSLLLRRDTALRRRLLTDPVCTFHCPRFLLVELFKHKERIAWARLGHRTERRRTTGMSGLLCHALPLRSAADIAGAHSETS